MTSHRELAHPGKTRRITVSFDHFTRTALEALSVKMQLSGSEVVRNAIQGFISQRDGLATIEQRAIELADSRYGEVKAAWAGNTFQPTSKPGPTPRFGERLSVTFPEDVYGALEDICVSQGKGITQVIRLAVDTYLARDIFENALSKFFNEHHLP